jgi:hypothetical protein
LIDAKCRYYLKIQGLALFASALEVGILRSCFGEENQIMFIFYL